MRLLPILICFFFSISRIVSQEEWKEYLFEERDYSFSSPCKMINLKQTLTADLIFYHKISECVDSSILYKASVMPYPFDLSQEEDPAFNRDLLSALIEEEVKLLNGTLLYSAWEKKLRWNYNTYKILYEDRYLMSRTFILDNNLFVMQVSFPSESDMDNDVLRFLNSFSGYY